MERPLASCPETSGSEAQLIGVAPIAIGGRRLVFERPLQECKGLFLFKIETPWSSIWSRGFLVLQGIQTWNFTDLDILSIVPDFSQGIKNWNKLGFSPYIFFGQAKWRMLQLSKNVSGTICGQSIFSPYLNQMELCTEKVRGMGLKPFVIISFNPLAEARGNRWNCLYR